MPDKLLELKNDLVFQKLFGKQKNSKITAHFLSLILGKEIYNIDLDVNKRMLGNRENSKTGRLDIRAKSIMAKIAILNFKFFLMLLCLIEC